MLQLRFVSCAESLGIVARHEPRLQFERPVPEDQQGHPIPRHLRFERRLVKVLVIETGKGFSPALHGRNEALLTPDNVRDVAILGFSGLVQRDFGLAPNRIERIIPQQKSCDQRHQTVASGDQITRLNCRSERRTHEFQRARNRLRPNGDVSH